MELDNFCFDTHYIGTFIYTDGGQKVLKVDYVLWHSCCRRSVI